MAECAVREVASRRYSLLSREDLPSLLELPPHALFAHPVRCTPGHSRSPGTAFVWQRGGFWLHQCLISRPCEGCGVLMAPSLASSSLKAENCLSTTIPRSAAEHVFPEADQTRVCEI